MERRQFVVTVFAPGGGVAHIIIIGATSVVTAAGIIDACHRVTGDSPQMTV